MSLQPAALAHLDDLARRHPLLAPLRDKLATAASTICDAHRVGGQLLICGNGGSAADSEHIAGELVKSFALPRSIPASDVARFDALGLAEGPLAGGLQQGVRAIALTSNSALLTAIANDGDGNLLFAQQVYVYGREGDVLLALSTSGNSSNVVRALQVAQAFGLHTIGLTNETPSLMDEYCDLLIQTPGESAHTVQELHLPLYHTLCLAIEAELFGDKA